MPRCVPNPQLHLDGLGLLLVVRHRPYKIVGALDRWRSWSPAVLSPSSDFQRTAVARLTKLLSCQSATPMQVDPFAGHPFLTLDPTRPALQTPRNLKECKPGARPKVVPRPRPSWQAGSCRDAPSPQGCALPCPPRQRPIEIQHRCRFRQEAPSPAGPGAPRLILAHSAGPFVPPSYSSPMSICPSQHPRAGVVETGPLGLRSSNRTCLLGSLPSKASE